MTEYDDLMKQAEEHNKQLHRTKDINVPTVLQMKTGQQSPTSLTNGLQKNTVRCTHSDGNYHVQDTLFVNYEHTTRTRTP